MLFIRAAARSKSSDQVVSRYDNLFNESEIQESTLLDIDQAQSIKEAVDKIYCILNVPSSITVQEFVKLTRIGSAAVVALRHTRTSQTYVILTRFAHRESAIEFHKRVNGMDWSTFSSPSSPPTKANLCMVLDIKRVTLTRRDESDYTTFPADVTLLPPCANCLRRLDESIVDGQPSDSSHASNLASSTTNESDCTVCRVCTGGVERHHCSDCETVESLWICMICEKIGCGRYVRYHAGAHYNRTHHRYAMDIETMRIWDYIGDRYVHRITTGTTRNQFGTQSTTISTTRREDFVPTKIDSVSNEYVYLMETQHRFFDEQTRILQREYHSQMTSLENDYALELQGGPEPKEEEKAREEYTKSANKNKNVEAKLMDIERELQCLRRLNEEMTGETESLRIALEEHKREREEAKNVRLKEAQEQNRDLTFFIDAQKHIGTNVEMQNGNILLQSAPTNRGSPVRKGNRKR
ncbi:putative brca1-associated protein [Planoprotostelium fungivorum]|uniref:Putative brca1-associated protein n=1 Tax=Planoprotostelium fungivorum TaxID=1890364 RepID=A0A2P6P0L0_9EUKA|nr:putative brca1-associated protein [Planoprotostelium fungivorum]